MYLFRKVVFDCKKATFLIVRKEEGQVTLLERLQLRYHLIYCKPCRDFIEQAKVLRKIGKDLAARIQSQPPFLLTAEARDRIQNKLSGEL
jgi:hypothetical protein